MKVHTEQKFELNVLMYEAEMCAYLFLKKHFSYDQE